MIYFDNAATTYPKPKEVEEAMINALHSMGNAGRGAHGATLDASRMIYGTREKLASLFHIKDPARIAFTNNATEALNIAIYGLLNKGDHVVSTECEHNSVLRPLYRMEKKGILCTLLNADLTGRICYQQLESSIKEQTKAIVVTHASNLTGNVMDLSYISQIAKKRGVYLIVDASQTAGILPIDVEKMGIDILCFTGHKGLLGPQGTGGIYVREGIELSPLKVGGSGVKSYEKEHPSIMPTALEAGTLNGHGIAGLYGALCYLERVGVETIYEKEVTLADRFLNGIKKIEGIKVYGDFSGSKRVATIALNVRDYDSGMVSDWLWEDYEIATRAGAHCAPLMHQALGTVEQGAVRFSFSHFNTEAEVDLAIEALKELVEE